MKATSSTLVCDYTVIAFGRDLPTTPWRFLVIDGVRYKPVPVMDAGNDCVAVEGAHDFSGKDVQFVA